MIKTTFWGLTALLLASPVHAAALGNPLGDNVTIETVIGRIIRAALGLAGSIALLMFIWGGFLWLSSRGEPKQIETGKEAMKWAAIGIIVILVSYTLVSAVISALTQGTVLGQPGGAG